MQVPCQQDISDTRYLDEGKNKGPEAMEGGALLNNISAFPQSMIGDLEPANELTL